MKLMRAFLCWLAAGLLAAGVAVGGVFCMATGYNMAVDSETLFWCCLWVAVAFAAVQVLPRFRKSICAVLWCGALAWTVVAHGAALWNSFLYVVVAISDKCASGYSWFPVLDRAMVLPTGTDATGFLMLWGAVLAQLTACAAVRRRYMAVALVPGVLSLAVCLILVDTLPAHGALFILLVSLCLLVLTQTAGRYNAAAGSGLALLLAVPVALLVLGISVLQPEATFERGAFIRHVQVQLTALVDRVANADAVGGAQYRSALSLVAQGEKTETHTPVMDVTSSHDGELYLRGQAYTVYTGTHWENDARTEVPDAVDSFLIGRQLVANYPSDTVKIETRRTHTVLFTPYHTMLGGWYQNLQNDTCVFSEGQEEYSMRYVYGAPSRFYSEKQLAERAKGTSAYEEYVKEAYVQLPETTRAYLVQVMARLRLPATPEAIASYVKTLAPYSLSTPAMPAGEKDFVIWFMEEGESGYCVHFASTAVAMLRAAGIPARYATGYVADCLSGQTVTVTSDTAHAWAEYYVDGFGWVPLEVTPGGAFHPVTNTVQTPRPTATPTPTPRPTPTPSASSEEEETVSRPNVPRPTARPTDGKEEMGFHFDWRWLLLPAAVLLVVGGFILRRVLGLWLLHRRFTTGPVNGRALQLWGNICELSKELGETPPKSLENLAKKARFSQHTLSREEMKEFIDQRKYLLLLVEQLPRERRFFLRYIKTLC